MISLEKLSLDILLKNAQDGDQAAQAELGRRYEEGIKGVEKDLKQSFEWYLKAAEQGNKNAQSWLVNYYQGKKDDTKRDLKLAFEWLKRTSEGQDSWSCSWSDCDGFLEITSQDSFFDIFQEGENLLSHYKYHQALEFFTTALKGNSNAYLHYGRGEALYWLGSYKKALESYDTALHLCPVHKLTIRGSFYGRKNSLKMLNISQGALEDLKREVINGKLQIYEKEGVSREKIDALIILLQDNYPITSIEFPAILNMSGAYWEAFASFKRRRPDGELYPLIAAIRVADLEDLTKVLSINYTVVNFKHNFDCDWFNLTEGKGIETVQIFIDQFLARNREYSQKAHQEILTAFEMNKVKPAKRLANIVHGYLCVNFTENLIKDPTVNVALESSKEKKHNAETIALSGKPIADKQASLVEIMCDEDPTWTKVCSRNARKKGRKGSKR